jgi:ABC-type multidrug transport system ATPase subunit
MFVYRMTLLLGPPGSGKTTLLLALAGKLGSDLKVENLNHLLIFNFKNENHIHDNLRTKCRFQGESHTTGIQ